jgi:hydrogenase maturation protease
MTNPEYPGVWGDLNRPPPESAVVRGTEIRQGSRVRLRPNTGGDVMDASLAGRVAVVEGIDQSMDGSLHIAVTLEDDPGRDLGDGRFPGHRFFFSAEEVEPIAALSPDPAPRILVAGIGNIFLGDDGFGVAVAQRMANAAQLPGVTVIDFGIRGLDLAYAMQRDYDIVILVDAVPRGGAPGTLYVIEPEVEAAADVAPDAHGMDPVRVLQLARMLGRVPRRTLVVGCEPQSIGDFEQSSSSLVQLSPAVDAALGEAVRLVESLVAEAAGEQHAMPPKGESNPLP